MKDNLTVPLAWLVVLAIILLLGITAPEVLVVIVALSLGFWALTTLITHYL